MRSQPLVALVRYEPGRVMDTHAHAEAGISVVLAGSIAEQVGGREAFGKLGSVVMKPAGLPHGNRVGPGGAVLLALRGKDVDRLAAPGWRWGFGKGAAALGLRIVRLLETTESAEMHEALDGLLRLVSGNAPAHPRTDGSAWLKAVRESIEDQASTPSVAALASNAGVHPASLARSFRRRYGCSVTGYIRRVRSRRAAALLVGTDLSISEIAAAVGCFDQSHLCRDFNAELGLPPSRYRSTFRQ